VNGLKHQKGKAQHGKASCRDAHPLRDVIGGNANYIEDVSKLGKAS